MKSVKKCAKNNAKKKKVKMIEDTSMKQNENSENRNRNKMEMSNLGKNPSCTTFAKGIPIIPGYKKHGLRGSL